MEPTTSITHSYDVASRQVKYYHENRDAINERKREKRAEERLKKEQEKLNKKKEISVDIQKLMSMGKNIFESVIDMRNDKQSITEYLNSVIEEGYTFAGWSSLQILIDYIAFNNIEINCRTYPWRIVTKLEGNLKSKIRSRKHYYDELKK
jgi:polynucleotide 5'-kinase involved in rRNA processing